jgi:tRNA modification GTPase
MRCIAAVVTGKGTGAISTIELYGKDAENILKKIFTGSNSFTTGKVYLGNVKDGDNILDQVTIGCEGQGHFAIHCHGNPLITSKITKLLNTRDVDILTDKQFKAKLYSHRDKLSAIAIEAKLAMTEAKTIEGTKLLLRQIDSGLNKIAKEWLKELDSRLRGNDKGRGNDTWHDDVKKILDDSKTAKRIIYGVKAVLAGPPNSGKSTLLNTLAGKEKVIITDISGTTRDWVAAECLVGSLSVEFIDTAGLDEKIAVKSSVDDQSQLKARQLLEKADVVLAVVDGSKSYVNLDMFAKFEAERVLVVLNKSDLGIKVKKEGVNFSHIVEISAQKNIGIDRLKENIANICGIENFDLASPVCFTQRQEKLLTVLLNADSKEIAHSAITELSNGQILV